MYTFAQIFGLVILLFFLVIIIFEIKKKGIDLYKLSMVSILVILISLILFQNWFRKLVSVLGFLRPFELFLTIAVISALIFSFVGYLKQKRNESDITKLVQNIGIKEWKEKKR